MPPVTVVMMLVVMMGPAMLLLLPESKPRRAMVKIQKGNDDGQESSKSQANDESNLDVVILRRIIRELSLYTFR
jgi:hypothetical protein